MDWLLILFLCFLLKSAQPAGERRVNIGGYGSYISAQEALNSVMANKTIEAMNFILGHSVERPTSLMSFTTPDHILFFELFYSVVKDDQILTNALLETARTKGNMRKKSLIAFRDWLDSKFNFVEENVYDFIKTIAIGKSKGINEVPKHLAELILVFDNKYKIFEKACNLDDAQTVKWFLESNFQLKGIPVNVLERSFNRGNMEIVKVLLEFNHLSMLNVPSAFINGEYFEKQTFLHVAASGVSASVITYLLNKGASINVQDASGRTPLYKAVEANQAEAIKILINANADLDIKYGESEDSILHVATSYGKYESVKTLVESGLSVDLQNNRGETPLHIAAMKFNENIVSFLHKSRADVNSKDFFGNTPLHIASFVGNIKSVKYLINLGAQIDVTDDLGQIPLFKCVESRQKEIITEFVSRNSSLLSVKSSVGNTVLHIAAESGDLGVIQTLLKLGAPVNERNNKRQTPLYSAALKGNVIAARLLQNLTDLRIITSGLTMLHQAALEGNANAVKILINSGIPVDTLGLWDNTPLHIAAGLGFSDVVRTLIELKANPNAQNKNNMTPLHKAAIGGYLGVAEILLNAHADAYKKDTNENTPISLATANNHTILVQYLNKRLALDPET